MSRTRAAVVGGAVKYSKNGVVFYTSAAAPTYLAGIERHFTGHLSAAEAHTVATALERVLKGFGRYEIVFVDDDITEPRKPVGRQGGDVARGEVGLDQPREIDVEQDVRVMDEKGAVREKVLGVLERSSRAEDRVLGEERHAIRVGRSADPVADHLGFVVEVDPDSAGADRGYPAENDVDQGPAEDRKERLGQVVRDRPQPLAETGRGEEDGDGVFGHRSFKPVCRRLT